METAITYERLFVNLGPAIVRAYSLTIQEDSNSHGYISLMTILEKELYDVILESNPVFVVVLYNSEDNEAKPLFTGIITDLNTSVQGDQYLMQVTANGSTYSMDMTPRSRTFQDPDRTNRQLLTEVITGGKYGFYQTTIEEKPQEQLFIQYEETDWEFLQRFTSAYGVRIFPVNQDSLVLLRIGLGDEVTEVNWDELSYKVSQDLVSHHYLTENYPDQEQQWNCLRYTVTTYDLLSLGSKITFHGQEMYIGKVTRVLNQGILINQYTLYFPSGLWVPQYNNEKLKGISIMGTVKDVQRNKVQVELVNNAAGGQEGRRWFAYSTMAASPDGSGWYAMPQAGETVRLFCPDGKEQNAYTLTCIATNAGSDKTVIQDWDIQALFGPDGSQVCFTEKGIMMKGGNSEIVLTNDGQVSLQNCQKLTLDTEERLKLEAAGEMKILSGQEVLLAGSQSTVKVHSGGIDIKGSEVQFNVEV